MKMSSIARMVGGLAACMLAVAQSHAAAIGLTLTPSTDPLLVSAGDTITFSVGMSPSQVITGYTLDIRYDTTEMSFVSASQQVPFFSGALEPPFALDPGTTAGDPGSSGLATSSSGRASVLQTTNSEPVGDLFNLTFSVTAPVLDGMADLTVGILNASADDINPPIGGSPFDIDPNIVSTSIGAVPIPAAAWLFGSAVLGVAGLSRRRKVEDVAA